MKIHKNFINIVYFIYCAVVLAFAVITSVTSRSPSQLVAILICAVALYYWKKSDFTLNGKENEYRAFIITLLTSLLVYGIYFLGQYPGYFSPDNYQQFPQAVGLAPYNDWHPVIHTLITFKLPLQISENLSFTVFVQYLWFCFGFAYLISRMAKHGCPKPLLIISFLYVLLNPQLEIFVFYPVKDTAMTTATMFMTGMAMDLLFERDNSENEPLFLFAFAVSTLLSAKLRHNGILFALPFFIIVLALGIKNKKNKALAAVMLIACFVGLKLLYGYLGVESPGRRTVETAGLPATIWCNVMKEEPESVSRETQQLLYSLADKETYSNYECGSFNSIKWKGFDQDKFNELSYGEILKITAECFVKAPKSSITALVKLTDLVWAVGGAVRMDEPGIVGSCYPEEHAPNNIIFRACNKIHLAVRYLARHSRLYIILFGSYGIMMLVLLYPAIIAMNKGNYKPLIMLLPILCYNFGTMLLLSTDDYHFFMYNIPVFLPEVFIVGKSKELPPVTMQAL